MTRTARIVLRSIDVIQSGPALGEKALRLRESLALNSALYLVVQHQIYFSFW